MTVLPAETAVPQTVMERITAVLDSSMNPPEVFLENKPEIPEEKPNEQVVDEPKKTEEANAEAVEEGSETTEEVEQIDEEQPRASEKPKSRAQERIQQLVAEKNALKEQLLNEQGRLQELSQYKPIVEQILKTQSSVQGQDKVLPQEYETQEDLAKAIINKVANIVEERLQPLKQEHTTQKYMGQINGWFEKHPEARSVQDKMAEITTKWSDGERQLAESQILNGNTFILDALYTMAAPTKPDTSGVVKKAIQADADKVGIGIGKKATKSVKHVNSNDSYQSALKTGNPTNWLREIYLSQEKKGTR